MCITVPVRARTRLSNHAHHTPAARLEPRQAPPPHYYAGNLLAVVDTVLDRYDDLLTAEERRFGERIQALPAAPQRLLARLISRKGPWLREDTLDYDEVDDVASALAALEAAELIERCPPVPAAELFRLLTRKELGHVFGFELRSSRSASKAACVACILARNPERICRWRVRRRLRWLGLRGTDVLDLYRLLFFGDRHQDLTTFVMRDLGVYRYEPVELSAATRQFADRAALDSYLALLAAHDQIAALGAAPTLEQQGETVAQLLAQLWEPAASRALERSRSHALNQLGRNLERAGEFDAALACYARSTLAPARERRLRILHRLGDRHGGERLRERILAAPQTALEADFAQRFARPFRRAPVPRLDAELTTLPPVPIEHYALEQLTATGGTGWHLENNLPMAVFALAYWPWIFAPVEGAFLNAFQTGPVDLFWPDFFATRADTCADPLHGCAAGLKRRLRATVDAKAGVANRLFDWRRLPPAVIHAVLDAVPEDHLRALVDIVRSDLAGFRSGFPDLTLVYGPGRYEFVEVKGPNDQLQIHQRLWIRALEERGLPVRVLRYRLAR